MFFIGIYEVNPNGFGERLVHVLYKHIGVEFAEKKCHIINLGLGFDLDKNGGFITEPGNIYAAYDHVEDLDLILKDKCTCGCEYIYLYGLCHECSENAVAANA